MGAHVERFLVGYSTNLEIPVVLIVIRSAGVINLSYPKIFSTRATHRDVVLPEAQRCQVKNVCC